MTTAVGVLAAVLTTAAWFPQMRRTFGRGTAADFAWPYLALLSLGNGAWCAYGALRRDLVIVVPNAVVLCSVLSVAFVKLRSRRLTFDQLELVVPAGGDTVSALESLVSIGPRLAADLRAVGIGDLATLRSVGTEEANRRLVESGLQTGTFSRQAIAGAIAGQWTAEVRESGRRLISGHRRPGRRQPTGGDRQPDRRVTGGGRRPRAGGDDPPPHGPAGGATDG